jgi:hypothetical protein
MGIEVRGCGGGSIQGECFDTSIEQCNTGLSVSDPDCRDEFGDSVCT